LRLFYVSAVVIRKAKPASMLVTRAVTQSVLVVRCSLVAILCERGGDTQGEACFNVSYLGSDSVSTSSRVQSGCFYSV